MRTAAGLVGLALGALGSAQACDLRIEAAWIREPPPRAATLAGYATIVNRGKVAHRIVKAEGSIAGTVALHETMMHGDMAMMHAVPELSVPAGGRVELAPGGRHLMLTDVKAALKAGDRVTITLIDETGCRAAGDFVVRPR